MKVLTIREPWASLIINGYKKYEFRSWKTNYRGVVLIHAGKGIDRDMLYIADKYKFNLVLKKNNSLVYHGNYCDNYAWKIENVKKYDKTIPVKGKLGLWNYDK